MMKTPALFFIALTILTTSLSTVQAQGHHSSVHDLINYLEKAAALEFVGVDASIYIYDDAGCPNAYVTLSSEILLGKNLLQGFIFSEDKGFTAIACVIIHEYGHLFHRSQQTPLDGKGEELLCDFLSGWFIGKHFDKVGDWLPGIFFDCGDYHWWESDHHGTPQERMSAAMEGFQCREMDLEEAYKHGCRFVKQ